MSGLLNFFYSTIYFDLGDINGLNVVYYYSYYIFNFYIYSAFSNFDFYKSKPSLYNLSFVLIFLLSLNA